MVRSKNECTSGRRDDQRPDHDRLAANSREAWERFGHYGPLCMGEFALLAGVQQPPRKQYPPAVIETEQATAAALAAFTAADEEWQGAWLGLNADASVRWSDNGSAGTSMLTGQTVRDPQSKVAKLERALEEAWRRREDTASALVAAKAAHRRALAEAGER